MTVIYHHTATMRRNLVATTLTFCAAGFVTGFVLSLIVATYSLYVCVAN
jgi:hypothetical protein